MLTPSRNGIRRFVAGMVLSLVTATLSLSANATWLTFDNAGNIIGSIAGGPAAGNSNLFLNGAKAAVTGGGVSSALSVSAMVATDAGTVLVPTVATMTASAPMMAQVARAGLRLAGPIGTAFTAYQLYQGIKEAVNSTNFQDAASNTYPNCLTPGLFCAPDPNQFPYDPNQALWYSYGTCSAGGCTFNNAFLQAVYATCSSTGREGTYAPYGSTGKVFTTTCYTSNGNGPYASGLVQIIGTPLPNNSAWIAANDSQVEAAVNAKLTADSTYAARLVADIAADVGAHQGTIPLSALPLGQVPVSISASPVTSPSVVTQTRTIPNADGSTSTETTHVQTTVTPVTTGTTISNSQTSYNTSTTTNITNVNNTTQVTTTTTSVVNAPNTPFVNPYAPNQSGTPGQGQSFPTDYARENTAEATLSELQAGTAPVMADQSARVTAATTAADLTSTYSGVTSGYGASESSWFAWVWTPPVSTCAPFSGVVHGFTVSFDLCPGIANIRDVLGWLFALFGAWEVYGLLFRRGALA